MFKTPWRRFQAYQALMMRRTVEERNAAARRQFERGLKREG